MRRARRLYGSREAVVDGDVRYTYEQFFARCERWAAHLQASGVTPGDRVVYIAPNTHAHLEAYYCLVTRIDVMQSLKLPSHGPGRLRRLGVSDVPMTLLPLKSSTCVRNGHLFFSQGHLDRKHAASTREVAEVDVPALHSDGLSSDREPEAETCPVAGAPVGKRLERVFGAVWNAAALVLHFDTYAPVFAQRLGAPRARRCACT